MFDRRFIGAIDRKVNYVNNVIGLNKALNLRFIFMNIFLTDSIGFLHILGLILSKQ